MLHNGLVYEDNEMLVRCNNCGWVGNDSDLAEFINVDGCNVLLSEIAPIGGLELKNEPIMVSEDDIFKGCSCCRLEENLMDLNHVGKLKLFVLESDEVGGEKDSDQILKLIAKDVSCVASFYRIVDEVEYRIDILNSGKQLTYINED